jgi:hypothetical protein
MSEPRLMVAIVALREIVATGMFADEHVRLAQVALRVLEHDTDRELHARLEL